MKNSEHDFFDFTYQHAELHKFIEASGIFSIMLKTGEIIHFQPESPEEFSAWLNKHRIPDLRTNIL